MVVLSVITEAKRILALAEVGGTRRHVRPFAPVDRHGFAGKKALRLSPSKGHHEMCDSGQIQ